MQQSADRTVQSGRTHPCRTCKVPPPVPYAGDAVIPSQDTAAPGPYLWKNVVIKGGGFVTGIVMSPVLAGLVFARTDVGGAYRYDPAGGRWMAITDWVGHDDSNLMGIESIAADPADPNRVYLAAGEYLTAGNGSILSSTDMGQTWAKNNISAPMGGNVDGRSMGERLAIDPNLTSTLYFGSRNAGLWKSTDFAQTWTQVSGFPTTGATNGGAGSGSSAGTGYGLTFVVFDPSSGTPGSPTPAIYVGVRRDHRNRALSLARRRRNLGSGCRAARRDDAPSCCAGWMRQPLPCVQRRVRPEQRHERCGVALHRRKRVLDRGECAARSGRLRRNLGGCWPIRERSS